MEALHPHPPTPRSQTGNLGLIRLLLLLQVFATYPNEDYDRRNEDVDPMAASAEYELEKRVERLDLFPVELEKGQNAPQSCVPAPPARSRSR